MDVELDAEQEVDVGRYWAALAARWWLPLAGLVLGALVGYLLSAGGEQVYRAEATIYLGQPFSPTGNAPVQGLATNPQTVARIARSESALRAAASASGTRLGELRGNVSTATVSAAGRGRVVVGQNPLVAITVKGSRAAPVTRAANALADTVVRRISPYVEVKIASLNRRLDALQRQLDSMETRISELNRAITGAGGIDPLDRLVLVSQLDNAEQRRGLFEEERSQVRQQLALAENVEKAQLVTRASAVKTTARSTGNSIAVGALIGLLLGGIAALLWEPLVARRRLA